MRRQRERVAAPPGRAGGWLAGAAALVSLLSACGQLSSGAGQPHDSRPATTAAVSPSATVAKAPPSPSSPAGAPVKHADLVNGVSCAGQYCTAVGGYYYGISAGYTLVERWNGSAWQLEPAPDSVRDSTLYGVSCPSLTSCVAVGSPVLTWRGAAWQVSTRSSPFSNVSCVTAGFCMAVGMTRKPVYGIWRGGRWRTATLPSPRLSQTQHVTVSGVSCATARFCLVVGTYATGATAQPSPAYRDQALAEDWDGQGWQELHPANVGRIDEFSAVSCSSRANCVAVGTSASQYPLAERWNGMSWRTERMPVPGTVGFTQLSAVSCGSVSVCVTVGNYQGLPIAEISDNGTWRLEWLPHPAGDDNPLDSVSCAGPATCMAVGGVASSYADRWDGSRWQLLQMQNPR